MRRYARLFVSVIVVASVFIGAQTPGQPSTKKGDWTHYTADVRGTKYSPLDQINAGNFNTLEVAWRFKTDSLGPRPEYKLEGTPLMMNGVVYATAGTRRVAAAVVGTRRRLLERRTWKPWKQRRADSLHHHRLSSGRARCEERQPHR